MASQKKSRKILYSPGFGAGWTTWNSGEVAKYMLTYQPIIDFLESGKRFTDDDCHEGYGAEKHDIHPLLQQLQQECKEKFDSDHVCVLGADSLRVIVVDGKVRINEYDGSESVEVEGDYDGWM